MNVNIIFGGSLASNRARGKYLKSLNDSERIYKKQIDIVINNFFYSDFDPNKLCILDISDGILTPTNNFSCLGKIFFKIWIKRRRISYLRKFDAVVCACSAQYLVLRKYLKNVYVVPDLSYYHLKFKKKNNIHRDDVLKFVWDGQSVNFPKVKTFIENNRSLFSKPDRVLYVITDEVMKDSDFSIRNYIESLALNVFFVRWDEHTYIDEVRKCDVGIAFVDLKCENSILKPENKLVNYLGLGLTAIASNTLAYSTFAENCPGSVIICNDNQEWLEAFEYYNRNKERIVELAEVGRKYVVDNYSESSLIKVWLSIISDLEGRN